LAKFWVSSATVRVTEPQLKLLTALGVPPLRSVL
jgi:hypothetical protein